MGDIFKKMELLHFIRYQCAIQGVPKNENLTIWQLQYENNNGNVTWAQYEIVRIIILCGNARYYCVRQIQSDSPSLLLDANAFLGAVLRYKARVLPGVQHRFYQRFTRVLPAPELDL